MFRNDTNTKEPRILCCAPSNAAVDEIALRLMQRLPGQKKSFVRMGAGADRKNKNIEEIHLQSLARVT